MPSETHSKAVAELLEGRHFLQPQQPESLRERRLTLERPHDQRAGESFARPGAERKVKVAATAARHGSKPLQLTAILAPKSVGREAAGIMDSAQNDQSADLEAPRQAVELGS